MDLREFVNSGLMALFFLVVGLEARREWDMGELRVRSRVTLPFCAGLGGMVVPIAIYLAFNAGRPTAHGWGAAMSTDTAFALGALALAGGSRLPDRVRTYLLTFSVVDDLLGLAVIAVFYSSHVRWLPLLIGVALLAVDGFVLSRRGVRNAPVYLLHRARRLGRLLGVRGRPDRLRAGHRPADLRLPGGTGGPASRPPTRSGCSASSRPRGWRPRPARWCAARSRRTSGCRSATTAGPAT